MNPKGSNIYIIFGATRSTPKGSHLTSCLHFYKQRIPSGWFSKIIYKNIASRQDELLNAIVTILYFSEPEGFKCL